MNTEQVERFAIVGAGEIEFGNNSFSMTGGVIGVHVGVSWGPHPFAGGVMSVAEVRKVIAHLQNAIKPFDGMNDQAIEDYRHEQRHRLFGDLDTTSTRSK